MPRLLSVMGDSGDARAEWEAGWQGVPLQALLPWAAQMLSLLSSPEGAALLPTLKVFLFMLPLLIVSTILGLCSFNLGIYSPAPAVHQWSALVCNTVACMCLVCCMQSERYSTLTPS